MSDQPERLCEQAQAGNGAAASQLVNLFYERVFAYFRRLCGNQQDAEDLTQKTFCKVWSSLPSFRGRSSVSTWIHGIGYHVYVDWLRQRVEAERLSDDWWANCAAPGPGPFDSAADAEMSGRLYALVEQLAEGSRQAVHLHYYQGLSLKETAEVMDIATSTVKYRLREALEFLRTQLSETKLRTN